MRIGSHEYANEADDNDILKLAQSIDTICGEGLETGHVSAYYKATAA